LVAAAVFTLAKWRMQERHGRLPFWPPLLDHSLAGLVKPLGHEGREPFEQRVAERWVRLALGADDFAVELDEPSATR
jgi:hypothetical protein